MKLKSLLFMVTLLLVCLGVRADNKVVFEQHFESEQTAAPTDLGFYEYINSKGGDTRAVENGALKMFNNPDSLCKTERWQRAVKFRNLPLEEGKTYRLDFKLKGSKTYNDGESDVNCKLSTLLLQGEDNADISLLDYNGAEQRLEAEGFNPDEFVSYSKKFLFASEQQQKEAYTKGELADKFFLSLSVYNPGTFYIKDVVLSETNAVATAEFGYSAIKINFCAPTNIADMAKADPRGSVVFKDLSYASVTIDGTPAKIESIEYREDGCLYIFTDPLEVAMTDGNAVSVTFTNPTDENQIKFNGKIESQASIFNFENVAPTYEVALDGVFSNLWLAPTLVSSSPQKNSFAIDPQLGEFSFTFDRKVATSGITAVLNRGGAESNLILKEGQEEYAETVVFVRNDNGVLAKTNKITLDEVLSEKGIKSDDPYVITFEAGKPKVAEEIITPIDTISFDNPEDGNTSGMIPWGWTLAFNINDDNPSGEVRTSGTTGLGSGPRLFTYQNGAYKNVFYVSTNVGSDKHACSTATYGDIDGHKVSIPAGELHIDFMASGYKSSGQNIRCEVLDATGENVLASAEYATDVITKDWQWGGQTDPTQQETYTVYYNNPVEQNVILRFTVLGKSGYQEVILSAVVINTYEKTEGDEPDDKIIFADASYGNAENNHAPKAESGWELYQNGAKHTPGGDYNYNSRIFSDLGAKNLKVGYYFDGGRWPWPNSHIIYGAGEIEGAPTLTLPQATLEVTCYAVNWKSNDPQEIHIQILNENNVAVVDKSLYTSKNKNMGGSRGAAVEADKLQFSFDCPKEGLYKINLGGGATEVMIGNISIIQPGSRAVKYYALLATAVKSAKETLDKCTDPIYEGTTKTNLEAAIAKYEDQEKITMTTEEEFNAAIAELNNLSKALVTRGEYVARFNAAVLEASQLYTDATGTKFENLDSYDALALVVDTYGEVDPLTLEDEDLIEATTTIESTVTLFKNMQNAIEEALTHQINGLADQLVALDETMVNDKYVIAARNAFTDDQEIATQLKLRITKAIYDLCAEGNPFEKEELVEGEPSGITEPDSIATTNFVQNSIIYVAGLKSTSRTMGTTDELVGWDVNLISGNKPDYQFSWEPWPGSPERSIIHTFQGTYGTDEVHLIVDNKEVEISQILSELPVGQYRLVVNTQDRGFATNNDAKTAALDTKPHWTVIGDTDGSGNKKEGEIFSYIFTQTGEGKPAMAGFNIEKQGQWYGYTPCNSAVFSVGDDGEATGSATIGAHMLSFGGSASITDVKLYMVGKAENYDYREAAAKVAARINGDKVPGDVNGDGTVDVADVQEVINVMLEDSYDEKADVNKDKSVDVADIQEIINIMLEN